MHDAVMIVAALSATGVLALFLGRLASRRKHPVAVVAAASWLPIATLVALCALALLVLAPLGCTGKIKPSDNLEQDLHHSIQDGDHPAQIDVPGREQEALPREKERTVVGGGASLKGLILITKAGIESEPRNQSLHEDLIRLLKENADPSGLQEEQQRWQRITAKDR